MIWVAWRQQRTEALIAASVLALIAALLVPTGIEMASSYHRDGLGACLGQHTSRPCADAVEQFSTRFGSRTGLIGWLTLIPGLIGAVLAAPFVLQLESGSYRLDWTQSISRSRWIAHKLGLAVACAILASLALTALISWWYAPLVHLHGRMENGAFDSEGVVVFGYTLFALGLALAVGVLSRRAVPAVVVGFAGYFAARLFVDIWLRQRLLTPLGVTWPARRPQPAGLWHAWVLSEQPSDRLGRGVALPCPGIHGPRAAHAVSRCLAQGPDYLHAVYQPASRFWALQGLETALFSGTALILVAFSAWWTQRRVS